MKRKCGVQWCDHPVGRTERPRAQSRQSMRYCRIHNPDRCESTTKEGRQCCNPGVPHGEEMRCFVHGGQKVSGCAKKG